MRWHGGGVEADRGATLKWYCRAPNAATNPLASQSMRPPNSTAYTMLLFLSPKTRKATHFAETNHKKLAETPSHPAVENDIISDMDNTLFPLVVLLMSMLANTASSGAVAASCAEGETPPLNREERASGLLQASQSDSGATLPPRDGPPQFRGLTDPPAASFAAQSQDIETTSPPGSDSPPPDGCAVGVSLSANNNEHLNRSCGG